MARLLLALGLLILILPLLSSGILDDLIPLIKIQGRVKGVALAKCDAEINTVQYSLSRALNQSRNSEAAKELRPAVLALVSCKKKVLKSSVDVRSITELQFLGVIFRALWDISKIAKQDSSTNVSETLEVGVDEDAQILLEKLQTLVDTKIVIDTCGTNISTSVYAALSSSSHSDALDRLRSASEDLSNCRDVLLSSDDVNSNTDQLLGIITLASSYIDKASAILRD